jgi:type IV pilus assembly protein PilA
MKNTSGITLMELVIVLAVLAIIAAILIPVFLNTTDRARLRADIQSAQVIHNAMELYRAERGSAVAGPDMNEILKALHTAGYLPEMKADDTQTAGAVWKVDDGRVVVQLGVGTPENIIDLVANLSPNEIMHVVKP